MQVNFEQINMGIIKGYYKLIGTGSGRLVFDLKSSYVVKVAKNKKGLAQNKAEYHIALHYQSELLARVLMVSDDFKFLIMKKAVKIKKISEVWNYYNIKNEQQLLQMKEIRELTTNYHLLMPDLIRPANWGKINGKPVIIDYGFTQTVRRNYY